jgi:hypothetical protein
MQFHVLLLGSLCADMVAVNSRKAASFQGDATNQGDRMTRGITRRDVIRVGSVIFVSGAMGPLQAALTGCAAAKSSGSAASDTAACAASTNVTRGPYFVDNQSDPNIPNDDVDASIQQRSDIRSDTKGLSGTQSGLPLLLNIVVSSYSKGACSPFANAQVHIWHCNAQGVYSDVQASSNATMPTLPERTFSAGISTPIQMAWLVSPPSTRAGTAAERFIFT